MNGKLTTLSNAVTSKMGRQVLVAQKHSPTLLFAGGVVGVVATVVLASRATLRLEEVLSQNEENLELAHSLMTDETKTDYSIKDYEKDVAYIRIKTAINVTKLYAPTVLIGAASIAALAGGQLVLTKRNAGLVAAYAALEKGFNQYRERVVQEIGVDKDREFRYGVENREVVIEDKNGGHKVKTEKRVGPDGHSIYAKFFSEQTSRSWSPRPDYNFLFLKAAQIHANDLLQTRGHVLLNDVYDAIGLDRTPEGAVVGWVKGHGDDYVSFGLFDEEYNERIHDFFVGRENSVLLDFNVDGVVYELI